MSIPRRVARVGDKHICPFHGVNAIIEGSGNSSIDGRPVARFGDKCACGCTIVAVSTVSTLDGRGIAYEGSITSSGGIIVECKATATTL